MTQAQDLSGPLLRSVSRSFYLTIRVLPKPLRDPIGLAYLLARTSDTIADSAEAPADLRLRHLANFGRMVAEQTREGIAELQRELLPSDESERTLLAKLPECLDWLDRIASSERDEIRLVLEKIIRGQSLDLQRFPGKTEAGLQQLTALENAAQLEEYTYLVAGCVGEFWTRICLQKLPRYSRIDPAELCRIGVNYGKGLQLVNILRDLPGDLRTGRCYLPQDELRQAGLSPEDLLTKPAEARPIFSRWHVRALELLEDGSRYISAIRSLRVRAGCYLPWYLGVKTLELLARTSPLEVSARIKVPRTTVRQALFKAPLAAFSNLPLSATIASR